MLLRYRDRGRGAGLGLVDEAVDSAGESGERTAPPEPVLSANASGIETAAEPIPNATARRPTRPICWA